MVIDRRRFSDVPIEKKSSGVKSDERGAHRIGPPLPIRLPGNVFIQKTSYISCKMRRSSILLKYDRAHLFHLSHFWNEKFLKHGNGTLDHRQYHLRKKNGPINRLLDIAH